MNKPHKHIAVVLVNYNGAEDTLACVKSICKNENVAPFIIIVDNSQPSQIEMENRLEPYDNVQLIFNSENAGFGKANNVGIQWAMEHLSFDFLLLLNNDTEIAPNALTKLTEVFKMNKAIGIATSKIMYHGHPDIVWYGGASFNKRRGWPSMIEINQKATSEGANKSKYVQFVSGCAMMFSRESIQRIKGFTTDFFMYSEDLELSLRAQKLGYTLYYEPSSVIYHKVQGSQEEESEKKYLHPSNPNVDFLFYHMKSNQYLTMKEHLSFGDFLIFNIDFWARYKYFVLLTLFKGKFKIIVTSLKTMGRILGHLFQKLRYE